MQYCYSALAEEQRTMLRTKCKELIEDESPIVRRTIANQLETLIDVIEKDFVIEDFIPIFNELADDDQVRDVVFLYINQCQFIRF